MLWVKYFFQIKTVLICDDIRQSKLPEKETRTNLIKKSQCSVIMTKKVKARL